MENSFEGTRMKSEELMKDREELVSGRPSSEGLYMKVVFEGPERLYLGEVERAESTESGLSVDRVPW